MIAERNQKKIIILCAGIGLCSLASVIVVGISLSPSIPIKDVRKAIKMDKMIRSGNLIYATITLLYKHLK